MALRTSAKWNALRPAYRARLIRSGITEQLYLSGQPLTAARGHSHTPERPERATRNPTRFPEYVAKHVQPIDRHAIYLHVRSVILAAKDVGIAKSYDDTNVERYIKELATPAALRILEDADYQTIADYASEQATGPLVRDKYSASGMHRKGLASDFSFATYDPDIDEYVNPFWYH